MTDETAGGIQYRYESKAGMLKFFSEAQGITNEDVVDATVFLKQHWEEVAIHKDMYKIDPDFVRYMTLLENNKLVVISARDNGRLIGYALFIVTTHLHYRTVLVANDDLYFVAKEYRKQGVGRELIATGEKVLAALGVRFLMLRTKDNAPHIDFLKHLGYAPVDIIYGKCLGGN